MAELQYRRRRQRAVEYRLQAPEGDGLLAADRRPARCLGVLRTAGREQGQFYRQRRASARACRWTISEEFDGAGRRVVFKIPITKNPKQITISWPGAKSAD